MTCPHDWKLYGGTNCGCHPDATCSYPVHRCTMCGDWDYGDNPEADQIKAACGEAEECKQKGSDPYSRLPPLHLTLSEFEALDDYSATLPTGAKPGRRWKRHDGAYDPACTTPVWIVGEYQEIPGDPIRVKIQWFIPVPKIDVVASEGAA